MLFPKIEKPYLSLAHNFARSYGFVPRNYPIFGALLRTYDRLTIAEKVVYKQIVDTHKPLDETRVPDLLDFQVNAILSQIGERYGITPTEVEQMEALYDHINALPAIIGHPRFLNLGEFDYGM
jgi:hypothetical protein